LKNQFQSTKRSLTAAREERSTLEQALADQASQLSSLQTQLSSAKAAYETETNLLTTFKERHSTQVADIQNTRKELIGAESDLSAIRVEKAEIEGAFLRDKEEARELHKRMIETGKQAEALRADVERLKKEAKQQKGLLAIARKQLSTKESEKAKAEREHAEAVEELSSITHDKDLVDAELAIMTSPEPKVAQRTLSSDSLSFAASQPIPMTPDLSILPPVKSNNPFERLAMSSPLLQRSSSPFSIQGSAPPSLSSTEPTSLPPGTSNEELPEPDLLAVGSTFNSFSAVQTPASPKSSQPSGDMHPQSALSPATVNDTDYFVTPPTSAEHDSDASLAHPKERFPSLDKLPDSIPTNAMGSLPKHLSAADVDTSLASQKELEIEKPDDSDSDSNDEKPLAVLAANISKQPLKSIPRSQGVDTNNSVPGPTSAFDDIFGPDNVDEVQTHLPTTGNPTPSNVSIVPSEHTEDTIHTLTQVPNVAGVNEFDETMGKMPSSVTPAKFSFDPGFDDNFDFASASKTLEEPKIEIQDLKKPTQKVEFDDIFKNDDVPKTTGPSTPFYLPPTDKDRTSGAFDAVFAGFESSPDLKVEDKPIVDSPTALSRSDEPSIPGSFPQLPSVTIPPAQSIITSPRPSDIKPTPPRERSPPPLRSPQPRSSSSSSSKDNHDKPKESQARHSKLSVRPIYSFDIRCISNEYGL
jgi:epidermal growth factor receptor substrate 15